MEIRTKRLIIKPYQPIYLQDYYREFTEEITKYQYPDSFPDLETAEQVLSGFAREMEAGNMLELAILSQEGEFLGGAEDVGISLDSKVDGRWPYCADLGSGGGEPGDCNRVRKEAHPAGLPDFRLAWGTDSEDWRCQNVYRYCKNIRESR